MEFEKTDLLSGLDNQAAFAERLAREAARAKKNQTPLSLLLFEVDDFDAMTGHYDHLTLEDLVAAIGHICKGAVRKTDHLARIDDGRFTVVMPNTPSKDACNVAELLRQTIGHHVFLLDGNEVSCTISMGVAGILPEDRDVIPMVKRAEEALHQARQSKGVCCSTGL